MKKSVLALVALGLFVGLGTTPALAGFNIGASYIDSSVELENALGDFEADNSSFKIFAGWSFFKWLAVEAQYVNLGEFDDTMMGTSAELDVSTFDLFAKLGFQFWRIDIFGKVGYSFSDSDIKITGLPGEDDSDSNLAYGVGAAIRIISSVWVRGEYEIYEVDDVDVDVVSLGVDIRFGTGS